VKHQPSESNRPAAGLCRNCAHLRSCIYRKKQSNEGGVWHCEEYL
jgi:hypothetical protein